MEKLGPREGQRTTRHTITIHGRSRAVTSTDASEGPDLEAPVPDIQTLLDHHHEALAITAGTRRIALKERKMAKLGHS